MFECNAALCLFQACEVFSKLHSDKDHHLDYLLVTVVAVTGQQGITPASYHRYTLLLGALLTLSGVQEMTLLLLWLSPTTGQKDPLGCRWSLAWACYR